MLITCPKCSAQYQIPDEVHFSEGKKLKCSNCQHIFDFSEKESESVVENEANVSFVQPVEEAKSEAVNTSSDERVFADSEVFKDEVPQAFLPVPVSEKPKRHFGTVIGSVLSFAVVIILAVCGIVYKDVLFGGLGLSDTLPPAASVQSSYSKRVDKLPLQQAQEPKLEQRTGYVEETPVVVALPQIQSVRFEKQEGTVPTIRIKGVLKNTTSANMRLPSKVRAVGYDAQGAVLFEKDIYLIEGILVAGEEQAFFGSYQPAPENVQWVDVTF